jgi:hypothetical protein
MPTLQLGLKPRKELEKMGSETEYFVAGTFMLLHKV